MTIYGFLMFFLEFFIYLIIFLDFSFIVVRL